MKSLTYNRESYLEVSCRWVLEVDTASVDAFIIQLDGVECERGWAGHCREVGSRPERQRVRPLQGFVERTAPHVETGRDIFILVIENLSLSLRRQNRIHVSIPTIYVGVVRADWVTTYISGV